MWQVDLRSVSGDPISRVRAQRAAAANPARHGRNILPICGNIHHCHIVHPPIATIAYFMDGSQRFQQLTVSRSWHKGRRVYALAAKLRGVMLEIVGVAALLTSGRGSSGSIPGIC
jgi:hypothetical protein